jgi:hypothetical protein
MNSIDVFTQAEARDVLDQSLLAAMEREPGILHKYGSRNGSLYLGDFAEPEFRFMLVRRDVVAFHLEKHLIKAARFLGFTGEEVLARFWEQAYVPLGNEENPSIAQECYLSLRAHFYDVRYWLRRFMGGDEEHTEKKTSKLIAANKMLQLSAKELGRLIAMETIVSPAFEYEAHE